MAMLFFCQSVRWSVFVGLYFLFVMANPGHGTPQNLLEEKPKEDQTTYS